MPDESFVEVSDESDKEAAAKAKIRGTKLFANSEFEPAILAYQEAEKLDPTDHVFPSNICACYLELLKKDKEPEVKVNHSAYAFLASQRCVKLNTRWIKGYLRKATAEAELLSAVADWKTKKALRKPVDYWGNPWPEPDPSLLPTIESASFTSCEATCRAGLALERGNVHLRLHLQLLRDDGHVEADKEGIDRALVDTEAGAPLKAQGNAAFLAKKVCTALAATGTAHITASSSAKPHCCSRNVSHYVARAQASVCVDAIWARGHGHPADRSRMVHA